MKYIWDFINHVEIFTDWHFKIYFMLFCFFYRIYCEDKQTFLQDCEDDGETAAGGRLLHLMQVVEINLWLLEILNLYWFKKLLQCK